MGKLILSVKDPLPTSATLSASGVSGPHSEAALNRCLNLPLHCTLLSCGVPTVLCPYSCQMADLRTTAHWWSAQSWFRVTQPASAITTVTMVAFLTHSARSARSSFMTLSSLSPVFRWRKVILVVRGQLCSPLLRACRLPDPYSHWGRVSGHCFSHTLSFQFSPYTGESQVSSALC